VLAPLKTKKWLTKYDAFNVSTFNVRIIRHIISKNLKNLMFWPFFHVYLPQAV